MLETVEVQKNDGLKTSCKVTKAELVAFEAKIALLDELIAQLVVFSERRKKAFKCHFGIVEKRIDELTLVLLEGYREEQRTLVQSWGSRPYEEYLHEKSIYE